MRFFVPLASFVLAIAVVSADLDRARLIESLRARETLANQTIQRLQERLRTRSWIPVYGFWLRLRSDAELSRLTLERTRAQTARIVAESGS
jgi:hypothetical protein